MAHPRVPAAAVERLRAAFVGMAQEPEGQRVLEASAGLIGQQPPLGFVVAESRDYDNYRSFYRATLVRPRAP